MYKIALLGCENSHAKNFLELIKQGLYPDVEVVGVYSYDIEAAKKLSDQYNVPVLENYDSAVGQVDGIMVTARHGDNHYKYAKPYLKDGIPMFIDKPITYEEEEGIRFMQEAKQAGVRLCGGSTCAYLPETRALAQAVAENECGDLVGGTIVCPYMPNSPYGGFFFYAQHLTDIMTAVFGPDVRRVRAEKMAGAMTVTAMYDQYCVQGTYVASVGYFGVSVYGNKSTRSEVLTFGTQSFCHEMDDMLHLLRGGEMRKSYEDFVHPVFIMNSILRASESGEWETIPAVKI